MIILNEDKRRPQSSYLTARDQGGEYSAYQIVALLELRRIGP